MQPRVIRLNEALRNMESLLRRTLGEHVELSFLLDPTPGQTEVDPNQLEQVLLNLVLNARDAMPTGGRLTIETADVELDQSYCITHPEVRPGPCVMLAVSDTGIGIAPEVSHLRTLLYPQDSYQFPSRPRSRAMGSKRIICRLESTWTPYTSRRPRDWTDSVHESR